MRVEVSPDGNTLFFKPESNYDIFRLGSMNGQVENCILTTISIKVNEEEDICSEHIDNMQVSVNDLFRSMT